jgi:uncharacterized protein
MTLRTWLRTLEPRVLSEFDRPGLAWMKSWLDGHDVFSFTRHPLSKGIAFGLFCGLIPGPLQVLGASLLCILFRGNIIAGVAATFLTNPLTIIPLYVVAFHLGDAVLPGVHTIPPWSGGQGGVGFFAAVMTWVKAMGWPLVVGLPLLALMIACTGYVLTQFLWLRPVMKRIRRMRAAQDVAKRASTHETTPRK